MKWLETALERIRAGEDEKAVLEDYGYVYREPCPSDCKNKKGRTCLLGTNHCIRRAEDYYRSGK